MAFSFLSAGLVLSVMVVPFIVSVSREVLLAVPVEQREAALALGATKWETTWQIVLADRQHWHHRFRVPCPGPRAGRDHGGHDGDWQYSEDHGLALLAGLFDCRRHRQRIR